MFLSGILSWWYCDGLIGRFNLLKERLARAVDVFSIDLMIRTLFSPFRQISAERVSGPIAVMARAFFDRLLSRIIGAIMRLFMIIVGVISMLFIVIAGVLMVIVWLVIPVLPVVGLIMMIIGVKL